jgi:hypothetical protein
VKCHVKWGYRGMGQVKWISGREKLTGKEDISDRVIIL